MGVTSRCAGCGAPLPESATPFRCPAARAGDDVDHVVVRTVAAGGGPRPEPALANPFARYRHLLSSYSLATAHGLSDVAFLGIVDRLDRAVAEVDGRGFVETPFAPQSGLGVALGFDPRHLWVKDETGNVSGSHKGRHLAGIMLYLQVAERVGLLREPPPLAIASCGNAALAAAVVASAAHWPLQVFVPSSANRSVLSRLEALAACTTICHRQAGVAGDPCYLAFQRAVAGGAIPFCCQGSDNGLTIEGGETLAWEMIDVACSSSGTPSAGLDAVFLQVGGGALASSIIQGFDEAHRDGRIDRVPRFHAVQTSGGFPLARAHERLVAWITERWPGSREQPAGSPARRAETIAQHPDLIDEAMIFARTHRSRFMWAWEQEPHSLAHGILDDEAYDWAAVVEGMLRTGGWPIVASEAHVDQANVLARAATGIDVDHTGSAGLAGLMEALDTEPDLRRARAAVIFSGVRRR